MTSTLTTFGTVFAYKGKEYVFLAKTENIIYAAEILSAQISTQINELYKKQEAKGKDTNLRQNILYCYVMLTTPDFYGRSAHMGKAGQDDFSSYIDLLQKKLDVKDLRNIKDGILTGNVPLVLKDLVKNIQV